MRTLKMLATATAIAIVPVAANAAFEPQKEAPLGEYVSLECVIVKTSNRSRDADPIYKINVDLELTPRATPTSLVVEHVSANGRRYSRDEQYTRSNLTFTPGRIGILPTPCAARSGGTPAAGSTPKINIAAGRNRFGW
jgi:hypothetical protein